MVALDSSYKKHLDDSEFKISIPFIAKDIAILRLGDRWRPSCIFPWNNGKQMETLFIQSLWLIYVDKTQLLNIYMKKLTGRIFAT